MKIQSIDAVSFGNRKTLQTLGTTVALAMVPGLSATDPRIEQDVFIRQNDDGWNPCDPICDEISDTPQDQREQSPCDECDSNCN